VVRSNPSYDCHGARLLISPEPGAHRHRGLLRGRDRRLPPVPPVSSGLIAGGAPVTPTLTAWAGPWGISFTANLTPDASGLAAWTVEQFIQTMRTGKHLGIGRPILPPMPWYDIGQVTDDDLRAMFAFLRTVRPVQNPVPAPIPPTAGPVPK
jgi:hypothetical protein